MYEDFIIIITRARLSLVDDLELDKAIQTFASDLDLVTPKLHLLGEYDSFLS